MIYSVKTMMKYLQDKSFAKAVANINGLEYANKLIEYKQKKNSGK